MWKIKIANTRSPNCDFNAKAAALRQYLSIILADQHNIFFMEHKEFSRSDRTLLSLDGVHCNAQEIVLFIQKLS